MLYPRSAPSPLTPSPLTATPFPNQPTNGAPIGSPTPFSGTGATSTGSHAFTGNPNDRAAVRQWVSQFPLVGNDPDYWVDRIFDKGGLTDVPYWTQWLTTNQNPAGSAGGASASPVGFGQFLQPYTGTFTPPTGTDDPGFQFALNEGLGAIQRSAAAKGNLLTGGVMKDLTKYATGSALQDYAGAFNRSLQTFGTNYDVFRNNQQDPYARLLATSQLGLNAAAPYAAQQTNLTTGAGNANAQNSVNAGNALQPAITAFGNWFQSRQPPRNSGVTGLPPANSSLLGG